eukprot:scaffold26522_cov63-Phaeocystis_antarctica.AAC.8
MIEPSTSMSANVSTPLQHTDRTPSPGVSSSRSISGSSEHGARHEQRLYSNASNASCSSIWSAFKLGRLVEEPAAMLDLEDGGRVSVDAAGGGQQVEAAGCESSPLDSPRAWHAPQCHSPTGTCESGGTRQLRQLVVAYEHAPFVLGAAAVAPGVLNHARSCVELPLSRVEVDSALTRRAPLACSLTRRPPAFVDITCARRIYRRRAALWQRRLTTRWRWTPRLCDPMLHAALRGDCSESILLA